MVFNAEISAGIEENLAHTDYGRVLAARGVTTVALNPHGRHGHQPTWPRAGSADYRNVKGNVKR
jgi:hypothetical protein